MAFRRSLESREADIARQVFGDTLDVSALHLAEGGLLGSFGVARTLPRLVTFPKGVLTTPQHQANYERWLVHELTHAYQYQQANIVADYYYLSTYEPHRDLSAYSPYIEHVRSGA